MSDPRVAVRRWARAGATALIAVLVFAEGALDAPAADWPQWRGPNRDGVSTETGWTTNWPDAGPKPLWRTSLGVGFSSVSIVEGRLYTMGNRDNQDIVWCLDAASGRVLWQHTYDCKAGSYPGPRMTPTVHDGRVYTLSRDGHLFCLDAASGEVQWQHNVKREFGVTQAKTNWGLACSPLVHGDNLILDVGRVLAFDRKSGALAWAAGQDKASYSSPVLIEAGGRTYVTAFGINGLTLVDLAAKAPAMGFDWTTRWDVNAATPVVSGDRVFISSGYNRGCSLLQVDNRRLRPVYEHRDMRNHCNNSVLYEGHLYGFDGQQGSGRSRLVCMEFATGRVKWAADDMPSGGLMIADGKIVAMIDGGRLLVADASPDGYRPVARAKVLDGRCWTYPVLLDGRVYCRSHEGTLVCLDVKGGP